MNIGHQHIELVWPGWFYATPGILLVIVMPCFLIYALYRYTSISKLRKIAFTPLCIFAPILIYMLIPLLISISGFIEVSNSDALEKYIAIGSLFGDYSNYVWTILTGFVVSGIYANLKKHTVSHDDESKALAMHE